MSFLFGKKRLLLPRERDPASNERSKPLGVIRADLEFAPLQPQENTIMPTCVPHPTAPRAPMDAPAVQEGRAAHLGFEDVVVPDPSPE